MSLNESSKIGLSVQKKRRVKYLINFLQSFGIL